MLICRSFQFGATKFTFTRHGFASHMLRLFCYSLLHQSMAGIDGIFDFGYFRLYECPFALSGGNAHFQKVTSAYALNNACVVLWQIRPHDRYDSASDNLLWLRGQYLFNRISFDGSKKQFYGYCIKKEERLAFQLKNMSYFVNYSLG